MALHFDPLEYKARIKAAIAALEAEELDGLLMFQQESMYYLTGYDTSASASSSASISAPTASWHPHPRP